jgi:hypothetical protein
LTRFQRRNAFQVACLSTTLSMAGTVIALGPSWHLHTCSSLRFQHKLGCSERWPSFIWVPFSHLSSLPLRKIGLFHFGLVRKLHLW